MRVDGSFVDTEGNKVSRISIQDVGAVLDDPLRSRPRGNTCCCTS